MGQTTTGKLTERRVSKKRISLGLDVRKPWPDQGIDLEVSSPKNPSKVMKLQIKGRNPEKDPNWRWFQIRVRPVELIEAKRQGLPADSTWMKKVSMADFFVLDAVKHDEMWVFSSTEVLKLIRLNGSKYSSQPDNVFNYDEPIKQKQKEMNLDIEVEGRPLTERFAKNLNNFQPILDALLHPTR